MKLGLPTLKIYLRGQSPIIGIPHTPGSPPTAIYREHLKAALSCPHVTKAFIDPETGDLTLNGGRRATYKLFNLNRTVSRLDIRKRLVDWADAKHARLAANATSSPKIQKLEQLIRAAKKQQQKVYGYDPNGLPSYLFHLAIARSGETESYNRQGHASWHADQVVRIKLSKLAGKKLAARPSHGKQLTWREFYTKVGEIIGREVSDSSKHDRVCNRRHGPTPQGYLQSLYKHVAWQSKPIIHVSMQLGSERHIAARTDYLEARRRWNQHQTEIQNLQQLIKHQVKV